MTHGKKALIGLWSVPDSLAAQDLHLWEPTRQKRSIGTSSSAD